MALKNYSKAKNLILSKTYLAWVKNPMLSYPTHFLEITVVYFGLILTDEMRQFKTFARRNVFLFLIFYK